VRDKLGVVEGEVGCGWTERGIIELRTKENLW